MIRRAILLAVLMLCGCAAKINSKVAFDPSEPIRVAVIPFYEDTGDGKKGAEFDSQILVDNLPIVSSKLKDSPSVIVQDMVQEKLQSSGIELVAPGFVTAQLGHHGFVFANEVNMDIVLSKPPRELGELLSADAILFGRISRWSRTYYGVQSVSTVAMDLKLVRASAGKVLFQAAGEDSRRRGLTGIPTGFSSIVVEPILGLDSEGLIEVSRSLVDRMLQPFVVKDRPEYLDSSAPSIFGAVHSARDGTITQSKPLSVLVLGTPGQEGYFSLGSKILKVPLFEQEPGHYVGTFYPLGVDTLSKDTVTVYLRDKFGRVTERSLTVQVSTDVKMVGR